MILLSRLIKSQWSNSAQFEKKIISIKRMDTPEKGVNTQILEESKTPLELIEEAKSEAIQIREQAKFERDTLYEEIQQERESWVQEKILLTTAAGEEGYKVGREEGQQQGYSEYQDKLKEAQQIVKAAKTDYTTYLETSEKTILDLATKIAKKVIGTKIEENGCSFLSLVKKALKEVKEYQEVQLHVHPVHYEELLLKKEELLSVFSNEANLFIYPDDELSEDSCLIESTSGRIDASVDTQLSEIKHKLSELLESESS